MSVPVISTRRCGGPWSGHAVEKDQGFGTGPATSGNPCVSLPVTLTVYSVQGTRGTGCDRVRIVFVGPFHVFVSATKGLMAASTVLGSIASLNVTTRFRSSGTPVVPFAGSVRLIFGQIRSVTKLQGFGTGPGTSGRPPFSVPALIVTR